MLSTSRLGRIRSLRTILLSLFVTQVLLAVGLTSVVSYRHSVQTVDEMASQLCTEIMSRVEQHLDSYLDSAVSINQTNVRLAQHGLLDVNDVEELTHYFWEQGTMFRGLGTVAFSGSQGNFIGANEPEHYIVLADRELTAGSIRRYAPTENGTLSDTILREKPDYDARQRGWFKDTVAAGKPTWTEISPSVTGVRLDLTATAPYYDTAGDFQGIFLTDISLSNISTFLQGLQIGKKGQAFIIENDWNIVATSFKEKPFVLFNNTEMRRRHASESGSSLVLAAVRYLAREVENLESISKHKRFTFDIDNTKHFLQIAPYRKHDLDFLTVIVLSEADFMTHITQNNRIMMVLIGCSVVVAVLLGAWMSGWIITPIRKLTDSAKTLGSGKMDDQIVLNRHDEVGELAQVFNDMASRINESVDTLRRENDARKVTEAAILETLNFAEDEKEKTRAIIAGIGDGISIQDTDYSILYQNSIHKEMFGDHEGEYCYSGYENKEGVCDGCPIALSFADGQIHKTERSMTTAEGIRYFDITTSPLFDSTGEIISGIEVVRDITSRRKGELRLAEEKERLAVTLRCIGDGVITVNLEGEVVLVNRKAEELTGWQQLDAVGRQLNEVFKIFDKSTGKSLGDVVDSILATGKAVNLPNNTVLRAADGSERIIADSLALIRDQESKPRGLVIVFRDVTNEVRTEQELLKVMKLESIGILAGGIAHDFNNILVAILGNLNLAAQMLDKEHEVAPILEEAVKASLRAKDLTGQLLTFAKGGEPVKELSSIGDVIRDSAQFVLHGAKTACTFDIPEDLWLVDIDRGQISQVVQNIIINAQHAMPEGGTIEVACRNISDTGHENVSLDSENEYIRITIADTGVGMPENLAEKIFDPYFTTKSEGSGLGLAISHSIIKKHSGHITVWSKSGKGTKFIIYLPAAPDAETLKDKEKDEREFAAVDGVTILLMDDDEMVRHVSGSMLEFMGHKVISAKDGRQAIEQYRASYDAGHPFDIVIMDLTVPGGMGGQEAVQEILKIDPKARAIVSSGYSNDPILADYRKYGFQAAVIKPFEMKELNSVINQVLY